MLYKYKNFVFNKDNSVLIIEGDDNTSTIISKKGKNSYDIYRRIVSYKNKIEIINKNKFNTNIDIFYGK